MTLIFQVSMTVDDVAIPVHFIEDPVYPLRNWQMKGFTHHHVLTQQQWTFNYRLNSTRTAVENAFGRLEGRWRCLAKRLDIATASVSDVGLACCVLHNICELQRDNFLPEWTMVEDHIRANIGHVAHQHA